MLASELINAVSGYIPLSEFSRTKNAKALDDDAASNTILAVRNLCSSEAQNHLKIDLSSFVLIADSDSNASGESEDNDGLQLAKELAETARAAAPAHACSSVLAGHASESDDYADIGILLGSGAASIDLQTGSTEKNARSVLSCLGLDALLSSEVYSMSRVVSSSLRLTSFFQINILSLSEETKAPIAFKASVQDSDVKHLASLLEGLSHRFAFSVSQGSTAFHFLLGQVPGSAAWAGLLGVGTWSD